MQKKGMHVKANGKAISTRMVTVAAAPFNFINIFEEISFAPNNKGCEHTKHARNTYERATESSQSVRSLDQNGVWLVHPVSTTEIIVTSFNLEIIILGLRLPKIPIQSIEKVYCLANC
ncbi:hypothetical protein GQX74_012784 [Glossina fuscipes]|nr:hypothetical protein GQX74_012784 [Glossina fuscipes]